ncbi:MAG: hypothetical protein CMJ47_02010 [Planctomyces sp.]|nr:hypothetical protein [Planctomyces sp.]
MSHKLSAAAFAALLSSFAIAQNATVSVLHGIPGLPQPVEVFANGNRLFDFEFGDIEGPLSVTPGIINLEVRLNGTTVLQASPDLQADVNYTVVAHLLEGGGNALTAFVNDVSRVQGIGELFATVAFRHVADAPAVDLYATRTLNPEVFVYGNVANGEEGLDRLGNPSYLLGGGYDIRLTPAGSRRTAFGPEDVGNLSTGDFHSIFAIGELGQSSFRLVVQTIETDQTLPDLQASIRGTACQGQISLSTTNVQFDQDFDVILTGGPQNGSGLLLVGASDERLFRFPLPFDLGLLGATGCSLYQSSEGAISVDLDANGSVRVTESIPASLAGFIERNGIYFQFAMLDTSANSLGLTLTDYAAIETN